MHADDKCDRILMQMSSDGVLNDTVLERDAYLCRLHVGCQELGQSGHADIRRPIERIAHWFLVGILVVQDAAVRSGIPAGFLAPVIYSRKQNWCHRLHCGHVIPIPSC